MAIELPGPVADFLNFIGISWPNVNEDHVREFGQHVLQFRADLQQQHQAATDTVTQIGQAYQGQSFEALFAKWGQMSGEHMSELLTACQVVGTATEVGADAIIGMKVAALAQLAVMVVEFIAAQAAAAATFGIAEAAVLLIQQQGRMLVKFLVQELENYVIGQIIEAACTPLIAKISTLLTGLAYQGVESALNVSGGGGGAGDSVSLDPQRVTALAAQFTQHASAVEASSRTLAGSLSSLDFA